MIIIMCMPRLLVRLPARRKRFVTVPKRKVCDLAYHV